MYTTDIYSKRVRKAKYKRSNINNNKKDIKYKI